MFAVVKLVAVKLPLNEMVPVVSLKVTAPALTIPLKVVPLEFETVRSPLPLKDATVMVLSVPAFKVRALAPLVIAPMEIVLPAATVLLVARVLVPCKVIAPNVMAEPLVCTVPLMFTVAGLLALPVVTTPPWKVMTSLPLPKLTVPVFKKLTALVMESVLPKIDTV